MMSLADRDLNSFFDDMDVFGGQNKMLESFINDLYSSRRVYQTAFPLNRYGTILMKRAVYWHHYLSQLSKCSGCY